MAILKLNNKKWWFNPIKLCLNVTYSQTPIVSHLKTNDNMIHSILVKQNWLIHIKISGFLFLLSGLQLKTILVASALIRLVIISTNQIAFQIITILLVACLLKQELCSNTTYHERPLLVIFTQCALKQNNYHLCDMCV